MNSQTTNHQPPTADERWATCLHESSHAVVANVLGGEVSAIHAFNDGGGVCSLWPLSPVSPMPPTLYAFMVAAGDVGEELLGDEPPPTITTTADDDAAADLPSNGSDIISVDRVAAIRTEAKIAARSTPHDDRILAEQAILGVETEPERWAGRIYWFKHEARTLVAMNRPAIIELATRLFHEQSIIDPFGVGKMSTTDTQAAARK